ncbi:histidine kinase [uncultured Nocardioides sp.]|uniref:sensor histidine kinase n=1 Tax=uncultured Nocardioides sp. TaxID=198441 RepID=UPI00262E70F4|nr:histidine kinase [uncultured Nocardioides sp.]
MSTEVALALVAASCLGSAGVAAGTTRLRPFAVLLALVALTLGAGAVAGLLGADTARGALLVVGYFAVAPVALTAYPRPAWRDPSTPLLALVGAGCGGAVLLVPSEDVAETAGLLLVLGVVGAGWWRVERSDGQERQLLLWAALVISLGTLVPALLVFATTGNGLAVASAVAGSVVPVALVAGGRRPESDVRSLVVPAVVTALTGCGYVAVLVTTWRLLDASGTDVNRGGQALVGFVLALAVTPVARRLRGVVDEVLFGHRTDPLAAAALATGAIGQAGDDPAAALAAVREALVLPGLALHVDGSVAARVGELDPARTLRLSIADDPPVTLEVALRPGDLRLSAPDDDVLRIVAPLLAQTVHARRLATELHASRGRVITAVEEERRRLRRDLHDGLGPRLSGMAFTTDAARNVLAGEDPSAAADLLADVRAYAVAAVEEVRGLVAGLRPPALDELGLAGALRQHAADVRRHDGHPLRVTVDAGDLGEVPAAAEVAAYRIAVEALTNVARHTRATAALVDLGREGDVLTLTVTDDDRTATDVGWRPGVGLTSMAQRAEALGGSLEARPTPVGGRVCARLPL